MPCPLTAGVAAGNSGALSLSMSSSPTKSGSFLSSLIGDEGNKSGEKLLFAGDGEAGVFPTCPDAEAGDERDCLAPELAPPKLFAFAADGAPPEAIDIPAPEDDGEGP